MAGGNATTNAAIVNRVMSAFSCPSDPGPVPSANTPYSVPTNTTYNLPGGTPDHRTNYDFSVRTGSFTRCNSWATTPADRTMFDDNSRCGPQNVTDGLSNTVAMLETRKSCCRNGSNANWGGRGWVQAGLSLEGRVPNMTTYTLSGVVSEYAPLLGNWGTTGSWHPGGLQCVLGDGSVRFLSQNMSSTIRVNLSRISDGQVIGEF